MPIRVGRRIGKHDPVYPNYTSILCLTPSTPYGDLSPYSLVDSNGANMENIWQFSKVYETVPKTTCTYSAWNPTVIWDWPEQVHVVRDPTNTENLVQIPNTN